MYFQIKVKRGKLIRVTLYLNSYLKRLPFCIIIFYLIFLVLASFCCRSKWKWKCLWRRSECSKMGFIDCSSWGLVPHFSIHIQRNGNIVTNFIFIRCHTYSPIDCPIILDITFKWNCTYRCSENRLWSYYRH